MMRLFTRRPDSRPSSESPDPDRPGHGLPIGSRTARATAGAARGRGAGSAAADGLRQPCTADATASTDLSDRVAQILQPYLAEGKFPGISVAVVTDGQVALAQGYGVSNAATGSPVQADTRFDIGSVTKTFTALGVLLLYQESQGTSHPLDLDAPISQYLHNTKSFKLPPRWSHITTMELLAMTSGIMDVGNPSPGRNKLEASARDPLLYNPGTKSSYSNANYDLLGELIEQWTGEKYGTFIQNQILAPLGMSADPGAGPVRHGPEPGGRLRWAPAREVAEGRGAERTGRCTPPPGWSRRPRTWPPT